MQKSPSALGNAAAMEAHIRSPRLPAPRNYELMNVGPQISHAVQGGR
jgi:hypothetical protein